MIKAHLINTDFFANFLNIIGYSTSFKFTNEQISVYNSIKIEIFESNSTLTLDEADLKYSKLISYIFNSNDNNILISQVYIEYKKVTSSNITVCQFVNLLLILNLVLKNFNSQLLQIDIKEILNDKVTLYQIGTLKSSNSVCELYTKANDKNSNKDLYSLIILIHIFSLCGNFIIRQQMSFDDLNSNLSYYNRTFFSHCNYALLVYFGIVIYINCYVFYNINNKLNFQWENFEYNDIKSNTEEKHTKKNRNNTHISFPEVMKSAGSRLRFKNLQGNKFYYQNFYLIDIEYFTNTSTQISPPIIFQSYLKLFVFSHISRKNIKLKINLTIQHPQLITNNINNTLNLFNNIDKDIKQKDLTLLKLNIFNKDKLSTTFKNFSFDELIIQLNWLSFVEPINDLLINYEPLLSRTEAFYVQEPATQEEYFSIERLLLEFDILYYLLNFVAHVKETKNGPLTFSFRFNCFICNISRIGGKKEISLHFNYSNIKEKTLFIFLMDIINIQKLIMKKCLILSSFSLFKNYNVGIRLFQNNFRSHQLGFFLQIVTRGIANSIEEQGLKNVKLYELQFASFPEKCQFYLKDPLEKRKKTRIINFKSSMKRITSPKLKFINNHIEEIIDLFDFVTIAEDDIQFNIIRTFDDNKIFFILRKETEGNSSYNINSNNNINTNNNINDGIDTVKKDDNVYIHVIIYLSNSKNAYDSGLLFIESLKNDKDNNEDIHVCLVCDRFYLENEILIDQKMKKAAKLLYSYVDDVYMIAKCLPKEEHSNKTKNKNIELFNYDIYIYSYSKIAIANFHQYEANKDQNYKTLIYEFISILSGCIELILFILKNKELYLPNFAYIVRTIEEKYYSFEYKKSNIIIKEVKKFSSLITLNLKGGTPLLAVLSKRESTQYTLSNDNFFEVFLRLFLNLNRVVDTPNGLNEIFFQKVHKNIFMDYYDSFYPIFFSYDSFIKFNDFFIGNNYLQLSKKEKFENCYIIPLWKFNTKKHISLFCFAEERVITKKIYIFNFDLNDTFVIDNPTLIIFSFNRVDYMLNQIIEMVSEIKKERGKIFNLIGKKIKEEKAIKRVGDFVFENGNVEIVSLKKERYIKVIEDFVKEKIKIKTQKVENRIVLLTENVKINQINRKQEKIGKDCIVF